MILLKLVKLLKAGIYSLVLFFCMLSYYLSKNKLVIDEDMARLGQYKWGGYYPYF